MTPNSSGRRCVSFTSGSALILCECPPSAARSLTSTCYISRSAREDRLCVAGQKRVQFYYS